MAVLQSRNSIGAFGLVLAEGCGLQVAALRPAFYKVRVSSVSVGLVRVICRVLIVLFACCVWIGLDGSAAATTLREAVDRTVNTNPAIEAARANRRATDYELQQSIGRRLPRADIEADVGKEKIDRPQGFDPDVNDVWRSRRQGGLVGSQVLFDGWERINDIYRNAARVDSAALRVLARSEALALDAIEAYVDVRRHRAVLELAKQNVIKHRQILARARDQIQAGKVSASEELQVRERIAAAEEVAERIRHSLLEAEAKFLRVVGMPAGDLVPAGMPKSVSLSRQEIVSLGLSNHPLIQAARADADAAAAAREQAAAGRLPTVSLEVRGQHGYDLGGTPGRDTEVNGRLVMRWTLFDGAITRNRQLEAAERVGQAMAERDDRARGIVEEIDKALAAYTTGRNRLEVLRRQVTAARGVVGAFETEYTLGKRSLLDLLTAQNSNFNAQLQVASTEAINVVSAYRLIGAMGRILDELGVARPAEAIADQRTHVRDRRVILPGLEPLR